MLPTTEGNPSKGCNRKVWITGSQAVSIQVDGVGGVSAAVVQVHEGIGQAITPTPFISEGEQRVLTP